MITPAESKVVRSTLGLTQKQVSENVGICNTDISKFECGRLVMGAKDLAKIEAFYKTKTEEANAANEDNKPNAPDNLVLIGGFEVPSPLTQEETDYLAESYSENQEMIEATLTEAPERTFFGSIDKDSLIRNLLVPMAENLIIIQAVLGHSDIKPNSDFESDFLDDEETIETYKDVIEHLLATPYASE